MYVTKGFHLDVDVGKFILVFTLVGLNAFFVAAEFALIRVRHTRIEQLVEEGNRRARVVQKILANIEIYVSTAQLSITMIALALGWIGESVFAGLFEPIFTLVSLPSGVQYGITIFFSFLIVTLLTVVVGELAPKNIAIQRAEKIALIAAHPLLVVASVLYPLTWSLNKLSFVVLRPFGVRRPSEASDEAHSEEELRIIMNASYKSGEINQSEFKYVNNVFEFDNRIAKEIMVPRTEIVAFEQYFSIEDCLQVVKEQNFTRYPILDGDKDHIIGMINIKEVLTDLVTTEQVNSIQHYMRPIIQIIETIPIHALLLKMQQERIHMAILMDEYGGTAGLVTVEDIIEEIVGEIRDEFDMDEVNEIRKLSDGAYIVAAKVLVSDINELLGVTISDEDIDTIGGWVLTENYEAKAGDTITFGAYRFTIIEMDDHQIRYLKIVKNED